MRKGLAVGLLIALAAGSAPLTLHAAAQAAGALNGIARGSHMQPLTQARVQLRNIQTGDLVGATTTTEAGSFSFAGLQGGTYIAEVIDAAGKVLGVGSPVTVGSGAAATTSVIAPGVGAAAASAGGLHLLGMGPVASMSVIGAAAAASVTAAVATRPNASPSR